MSGVRRSSPETTSVAPVSGRERLINVAAKLLAQDPPSAISGRFLAKEAGIHPTFVGQCFGPIKNLFECAQEILATQFLGDYEHGDSLEQSWTAPMALAKYPDFWRTHVHMVLDEGNAELTQYHPARHAKFGISKHHPRMSLDKCAGLAASWWSLQVGALVFERPLKQGFGVTTGNQYAVEQALCQVIDRLIHQKLPSIRPSKLPPEGIQLPAFEPAKGRKGAEDALLKTAMKLFCERAAKGVSGRQLSSLANVNYGSIHHYFGSKEAVFDQAFVMLHNHYIEDLMKVSANQRNLRLMQHESFLRGWAARQLADSELPTIELKGMEVLLGLLVDNRQIDARNNAAMVQARADAYAVTAMLLGWVLCRRNLSLALETDEAVLLSYLLPIQKYIQKGH